MPPIALNFIHRIRFRVLFFSKTFCATRSLISDTNAAVKAYQRQITHKMKSTFVLIGSEFNFCKYQFWAAISAFSFLTDCVLSDPDMLVKNNTNLREHCRPSRGPEQLLSDLPKWPLVNSVVNQFGTLIVMP